MITFIFRNNDMQEVFLDLKKKMKEREEDFKKSDLGELVL